MYPSVPYKRTDCGERQTGVTSAEDIKEDETTGGKKMDTSGD